MGGMAMFRIDGDELLVHVFEYAISDLPSEERAYMRAQSIAHIVELIDGYLLGTVMLIFSLGLYALFISKIEIPEKTERGSKVLMIKIVPLDTPLERLYMSASSPLSGLALYLCHAGDHGPNA